MTKDLRMYAITSREALAAMGGNRGKLSAQAGHAYLHAWWDADERFSRDAIAYAASGAATKVTLVVEKTDELAVLHELFKPICGTTLVKDAGKTVFKEPTVTFVGIGPITKEAFADLAPGLRPLI